MPIRVSRRDMVGLVGAASAVSLITSRGPFSAARAAGKARILLINPKSNQATTDMMVQIAQLAASDDIEIADATAPHSPMMIIDAESLAASAPQVVEIGVDRSKEFSGIIISAFGDPGFAELTGKVSIPVVGIAQSAMLAAAANGRRFGVATTTPKLAASIDARAAELGLAKLYTGTRLTPDDPNKLVADPAKLVEALRQAVSDCITLDKAEAVIIGGGPLGNAATALRPMFSVPVIAPIPEAVHRMMGLLASSHKS